MKHSKTLLCLPLTVAIAVSLALTANASEKDIFETPLYSQIKQVKNIIVERDENGVRNLDLTNINHYNLAKSRLQKAGKLEKRFPQLHNSLNEIRQQQLLHKKLPEKTAVNNVAEVPTQVDIIENAHFFLDMNVAVSGDNNEPYLMIRAKSSVYGGTQSTYIDLLIEDGNGGQLAPMGSTLNVLDGKNTIVSSVVSLKTLKQQFPNLENIYASSYVETENADGSYTSTLKYTEYPFSWGHIDIAYGDILTADKADSPSSNQMEILNNDGRPVYTAVDPVDKNNDAVIKVCLNRDHSDCDYAADQYQDPNEITDVNIPFQGQIRVGHEVTEIYATDLAIEDRPNGVDEITNIYLQEGNYGGATKQSYLGLDNSVKNFSDYLQFDVDTEAKETLISWDIPREEGRFGNAKLFSNIAEANWYITFAVKGYPYFIKRGRGATARAFQISITSEEAARFGNYYSTILPKIKLGYSCLAKGTMITMADGSQMAIETIGIGDQVKGALAMNPSINEAMEVADVSVGIEAIEMYRLHLADGNSILMTETHPISTSNKGIVWAKELEAGDRVLNLSKSVLITKISKESYKDKIYNLKLKPLEGSKISSEADLGMFANDLLVGDLSTQDKFNYKDQKNMLSKDQILKQLPNKWKTDYLNSL
ncbi:hypothetical protein CJF42_00620 [Pseudoalteromonas sp. NBT06-2]|uniref:Hint domain-containing protein n=1 Tax=Pseudoalteromonas sp. NBT06-2 TaxID=2025950 RepID=UPI000BA7884A|nr:Hint domain-containing protein [Pseudoalteromonas sp. NBT06-2]PAJ76231.1 hypothetical protein CJF42_00620 [Pseudoalteromonas sp. NBT06-2]